MPKAPDPELEGRILSAAVRLLDRGGEHAVTMRSVAVEAGTTTPTIYERFRDRNALMQAVVEEISKEVLALFEPSDSVEQMFAKYLQFNGAHPMRFNLSVETFGTRLAGGEKMPVFDRFRSRIAQELAISAEPCEELALAIASLLFGTMRGMIAVGLDTRHARELRRTSLAALRKLLAAFSERKPTSKRSK